MKRLIGFVLLLFSLHSNAQKYYLQVGAGRMFPVTYYWQAHGIAEMNMGVEVSKVLYLGIGSTYIGQKDSNNYIPVYVDLKVIAPGIFRPYFFLQGGYGIYSMHYFNDDPNIQRQVGISGGFYTNVGVGINYRKMYLQLGYRTLNTKDEVFGIRGAGAVALTAGLAIF